jgi:hypothetical protein
MFLNLDKGKNIRQSKRILIKGRIGRHAKYKNSKVDVDWLEAI